MGLFTYKQTKATKKEVHKLAQQQAAQHHTDVYLAQRRAAEEQTLALFQQLPPEGKEEYRAWDAWLDSNWPRPKDKKGKLYDKGFADRAEARKLLFRKYDLIP